jgi:prophage tail gpP-like protein
LKAWEFANVDVLKFAQKICAPFNITVSVQAGLVLPSVRRMSIGVGETCFNALETACRLAGVFMVSDGFGGIVLTRAGSEMIGTPLVEGQNIKGADVVYDHSGRFAKYVVYGQHVPTDQIYGASASQVKAEALDSGVARSERVLVIRPEGNVTPASARALAQWEATVRAAKSMSVNVAVQGWESSKGALWSTNRKVSITSPSLDLGQLNKPKSVSTADLVSSFIAGVASGAVNTSLLITQVQFNSAPGGGTTTQLTLRHPEAFDPKPVIDGSGAIVPWVELKGGV